MKTQVHYDIYIVDQDNMVFRTAIRQMMKASMVLDKANEMMLKAVIEACESHRNPSPMRADIVKVETNPIIGTFTEKLTAKIYA